MTSLWPRTNMSSHFHFNSLLCSRQRHSINCLLLVLHEKKVKRGSILKSLISDVSGDKLIK